MSALNQPVSGLRYLRRALWGAELSQGGQRTLSYHKHICESIIYYTIIFNSETLEYWEFLEGAWEGRKEGEVRGCTYRCHSPSTPLSLNFLVCKNGGKTYLAGLYCED